MAEQSKLKCDFVQGAVNHRLLFGGGRGQDLPKAGMKIYTLKIQHIKILLQPLLLFFNINQLLLFQLPL